jgi:hypothetical protein
MPRLFASLLSCLLIACLLIGSGPAADAQDNAQAESFWAFLPEGRVVSRCVEGSAAQKDAIDKLQRLDQRIRGLADTTPVAQPLGELYALLKTECFLAAAETNRIPKPDTTRSLKEWWTKGFGGDWLSTFLVVPQLGAIDRLRPHIALPPDARKTLDLEGHRDHPLSTLLCPTSDAACGGETRGWRRRAEKAFDAHRKTGRHDTGRRFDEPWHEPSPVEVSDKCDEESSDANGPERYQRWRACVETARPKRIALPLGDVKSPKTGWLIVAGRRGHYEFCDTVRAYDLKTGAAFIHDSCSELALHADGKIDRDATDTARVRRVQAGVVPVENLREVVWMLLLRGEVEDVQLNAEYYPLPDGVTPQGTVRRDDESMDSVSAWSTGQTTLTWRWIPETGPVFVGDVTWPASYDAADDHAVTLLEVAEAGFVERCPPRQAPSTSPAALASRPVRNLNEVDDEWIGDLDRNLRDAAGRWKSLRSCTSR